MLHAARNGHNGVVSVLLEHGASVNALNIHWTGGAVTALQLAAEYGREAVVAVLLKHGASAVEGEFGMTALQRAVANGHGSVGALLLERFRAFR